MESILYNTRWSRCNGFWLVWFAVQLMVDRVEGDQKDRWWAIAFSTFYLVSDGFFRVAFTAEARFLKSHGRGPHDSC